MNSYPYLWTFRDFDLGRLHSYGRLDSTCKTENESVVDGGWSEWMLGSDSGASLPRKRSSSPALVKGGEEFPERTGR